jgi:hypothetical protein
MSGYKYVNGVYEVYTPIHDGFKRFHSMNAQYRVQEIDGTKVWQFISYATPILQVVRYDNVRWLVSFLGNPFDYSPSTSRQVSRFIRENVFPFTASDVRDLLDSCSLSGTPDCSSSFMSETVCIEFRSKASMIRVWR